MDVTNEKIKQFKQKCRRVFLCLLALAAFIGVFAFLLYRYTDLTFLMFEPAEVDYDFRCDNRDIQHRQGDDWEDFFVRGVELDYNQNNGNYEDYTRWLTSIRSMNANAVRVHALMPPDFYRALLDLNQSGEPLWLIQGIELADDTFSRMTDMRSGKMVELLKKEGRLVLDAVHGNKSLMGYDSDVSDCTIAYVVGDHWDPDLVLYTDETAKDIAGRYSGRYAAVWNTGKATPTLLAEVFNDLFSYETRKYAQQHIIGLGNAQNTDMLFHDVSWSIGLNENIASLNTAHIAPTKRVKTGIFAALRVDTGVMQNLSYDPAYIEYTDPDGRRNAVRYYLDALYNAHRIPLLLGGTTMSASRGASGLDVLYGYDRGGVGEELQGEGLCFVYQQAVDAGFCGGCAGYYLDNPLRTAWNMEKFTRHNENWLDVQDSEQGLGLAALEPDSPYCVDGQVSEWIDQPVLVSKDGVLMQAAGDARYLYLRLRVQNFDPQNDVLYIPFDITPSSGALQNRSQNLTFDRGMDFLLSINGKKRAKLTVQFYYDPVEALYDQELDYEYWFVDPPDPADDNFVEPRQYVRPELYPETMESIDAVVQDTGLLLYGSADPDAEDYNSLACYAIEGSNIEVRIPWALLNFTDPSRGEILGDFYTEGQASIKTINEMYIGLAVYQNNAMTQYESGVLPLPCYEAPVFRERLRAAYGALQALYGGYAK